MDLLAKRPAMPARGPAHPLGAKGAKELPVQISRCETVTDVATFIRATLRQVEARLHGHDRLARNWTLPTLIEHLAAVDCSVALVDKTAALQ
jgi:hypothetical protein